MRIRSKRDVALGAALISFLFHGLSVLKARGGGGLGVSTPVPRSLPHPVREYRPPGSVGGVPGNLRTYPDSDEPMQAPIVVETGVPNSR